MLQLRLSLRRQHISIESAFNKFSEGEKICRSTVSKFLSTEKPKISSPHDYVFVNTLVQQFLHKPSVAVTDHINFSLEHLDLTLVSAGDLSMMIAVANHPEELKKLMDEYFSRFQSESSRPSPVTIIPVSNQILRLAKRRPEWQQLIMSSLTHLDTDRLTLDEMVKIQIFLKSREFSNLTQKLVPLTPMLSPSDAANLLVALVSQSPSSPLIYSLIEGLKKNLLNTESLNADTALKTISALGRIGSITRESRRLVIKNGMDRMVDEKISILGMGLHACNIPNLENEEEKFDPKFVRAIDEAKLKQIVMTSRSVTARIRAAHSLAVKGGCEDYINQELVKQFISKISRGDFESVNQLVELSYLVYDTHDAMPDAVTSLISMHATMERERLLKDPVVDEVMKFFNISDFSDMKEGQCLLPVIRVGDVMYDIDSYANACTRRLRGKLATEKFGLKYRVIDPLSWQHASGLDKKEYLDSLLDNVFGLTTPLQTGGDIRVDETPKTPFFGYIRKNDLK